RADDDGTGTGDGGGISNATATLVLDDGIVAGNADSGGEGVDCSAGAFGSIAIGYAIIPSPQTCATHFVPAPVCLLAARHATPAIRPVASRPTSAGSLGHRPDAATSAPSKPMPPTPTPTAYR